MKNVQSIFLAFLCAASPVAAHGVPPESYDISIKDHRFSPSEITIPANAKVKLIVTNQDATAEEFESKSLKREKVIPGNSKAVISIGPLKPGTYEFVGEFNEATAKGHIIVK